MKFFDHRWQRRILEKYVLDPANAEEDENGEVETKHIHLQKTKTEQKMTSNQSQKTQMQNGDMIEEVFNSFEGGVKTSGDVLAQLLKTRESW